MKVSTILLMEDFDVNKFIVDILNMFRANSVKKTNINNVMNLIKKRGITYIDDDSLRELLQNNGFELEGNNVIIDTDDLPNDDIPDNAGKEYDPVGDLAKNTAMKDIK